MGLFRFLSDYFFHFFFLFPKHCQLSGLVQRERSNERERVKELWKQFQKVGFEIDEREKEIVGLFFFLFCLFCWYIFFLIFGVFEVSMALSDDDDDDVDDQANEFNRIFVTRDFCS